MAGTERLADDARGDAQPLDLDRRHHIDGEVPFPSGRGQQVRGAGAVVPEAEIEPHHGARDTQPVQQDVVDEALRRRLRQRRVEPQHDGARKPGRREQAQLGGLVGEAEQRLLRPQEAARMGLEGQRGGRPCERAGALARRRDHRPVAAMHAVEIADGDDRADELRGERRLAVADGERVRLRRDVGHRVRFG